MQKRAILHTLFFLLGFSIIFIALGLSTTLIGELFVRYSDLIRQVGAIFIIFFGFVIVGIFKPKFLMQDKKLQIKNRPSGYLGSSLIGIGFAAGWTPCTGPILAGIIALGMTNPEQSMFYMFAYILGFSIPFFLMAFFMGRMKWIKRNSQRFMKVGGYLMIGMGVVLYFDWMTKIVSYLTNNFFGGFTGF